MIRKKRKFAHGFKLLCSLAYFYERMTFSADKSLKNRGNYNLQRLNPPYQRRDITVFLNRASPSLYLSHSLSLSLSLSLSTKICVYLLFSAIWETTFSLLEILTSRKKERNKIRASFSENVLCRFFLSQPKQLYQFKDHVFLFIFLFFVKD